MTLARNTAACGGAAVVGRCLFPGATSPEPYQPALVGELEGAQWKLLPGPAAGAEINFWR